MSTRLRINNYLLPILIVLLIALQILYPSKIWKMLLTGLGGAWLLGFFWARALSRSLKLTREMRYGWAQVGDRLEERFTITNASFFPATWIDVNDHSTMPGYIPSRATSIYGNNISQWETDGVCRQRGLFVLGGTTLQTGDPLGICTVTLEDPASTTILVLPPVVPLPPIAITPGGYSGDGRPQPRAPERTAGAAGVREYQPGDSIRLIHWPSTARHDKPYVRLFDGTASSNWWILLDLERGAQSGQGQDSTEEHGVILAASLTDRAIRQRQAVGLTINGQDLTWIAPQTAPSQRLNIMRSLALAQPGDLKLGELLKRTGKSFGKGVSLLIITASLDPGWLEALLPLTWKGINPTILLLDPQSFGGTGTTTQLEGMFQHLSLTCHIITRDLLNRPEAQPGHRGQWEWRSTPTGRAIAKQAPANSEWGKLS